jgi:hypothetical protein
MDGRRINQRVETVAGPKLLSGLRVKRPNGTAENS